MDKQPQEVPRQKSQIARGLLRIGAVALRPNEPFTWASGRRAPVYCDNRLTLAHPALRARIADAFTVHTRELGAVDVVAGTATAGIPHAALVADRLDLPMAYVRATPKGHGKQNLIEGRIEAGQRVVVIEDLVSTGGSSLAAARAVRDAGGEPVAVLAIFTYGFDEAQAAFDDAGIPLISLTDFKTLIGVAVETDALPEEQVVTLLNWRADAAAWSRVYGGTA